METVNKWPSKSEQHWLWSAVLTSDSSSSLVRCVLSTVVALSSAPCVSAWGVKSLTRKWGCFFPILVFHGPNVINIIHKLVGGIFCNYFLSASVRPGSLALNWTFFLRFCFTRVFWGSFCSSRFEIFCSRRWEGHGNILIQIFILQMLVCNVSNGCF